MTVQEAADYLRIHRSTLYRLIKEKRIPAFRVGSDFRIVRSLLEKTMRENAKQQMRAAR